MADDLANQRARQALKRIAHMRSYGFGQQAISRVLKQGTDLELLKLSIENISATANNFYDGWVESMKQAWIIDGEWSQYHSMVAAQRGWGLVQKQGMWEITTLNTEKFPTDDDARKHVLDAEIDGEHLRNSIQMLERNLGPMLMLYEMASLLTDDRYEINLDTGPVENTYDTWLDLLALREEKDRRDAQSA